jgi:hypothetical protein
MKIELNMWGAVAVSSIAVAVLLGFCIFEVVQYNSLAWTEGYTMTTLPGCAGAEWVKPKNDNGTTHH